MFSPNQYTRASAFAGQTVRRLERGGISAEEARRLVVAVINEEEIEIRKGERAFDEKGMIERLRQLPQVNPPSEAER